MGSKSIRFEEKIKKISIFHKKRLHFPSDYDKIFFVKRKWRNGRRARFRFLWELSCEGSSPFFRMKENLEDLFFKVFYFSDLRFCLFTSLYALPQLLKDLLMLSYLHLRECLHETFANFCTVLCHLFVFRF